MYDKNGNYTIVTKVIFDANMKRLRDGESVHDIARSMHEQVKVLEYNGPLLDQGIPLLRYWEIYRKGLKWNPVFQAREALAHMNRAMYSGSAFADEFPLRIKKVEYPFPDWWEPMVGQIIETVPTIKRKEQALADLKKAGLLPQDAFFAESTHYAQQFGYPPKRPSTTQPIVMRGNMNA